VVGEVDGFAATRRIRFFWPVTFRLPLMTRSLGPGWARVAGHYRHRP
jgi:hypothetical protein